MKVPRFLKTLMAVFVCLALIRALNGAGPLSLMDLLLKIQEFDFTFSPFLKWLEYTSNNFAFDASTYDGFLGPIVEFFKMIAELFDNFSNAFVGLFDIVGYITGFTT